jgi:hypothetical protein
MANNTQILIECIALIAVTWGLYKQVKVLFPKRLNGYTIIKESSLFTVYKDSKAHAQFIYKRSAIEYCKAN